MRLNVPRSVVCAASPFFAVGCTSAGTCLRMCCRAGKATTTNKQTNKPTVVLPPRTRVRVRRAFCALGLLTQRLSRRGFCDGVCRK